MRVLILLPPSEGKSVPQRGRALDLGSLSSPSLTPARARVLAALLQVSESPEAAAVLGLTAGQSDEITRNRALSTSATGRADEIYTGVLFDALGFATLSAAARRRPRAGCRAGSAAAAS